MSEPTDDFLDGLRLQFCDETKERLLNIESIILEMESEKRPVRVDELKRELHSVKGNARATGFEEIEKVTHEIESFCETSEILALIDPILKCLDDMNAALKQFENSKQTDLMKKLKLGR
jgi:chemotaxis protein histidine kinase CheA